MDRNDLDFGVKYMKKQKLIYIGGAIFFLCIIIAVGAAARYTPQGTGASLPSVEPYIPVASEPPVSTPVPTEEQAPIPDTVPPVIEGVTLLSVSLGDSVSYRKNVTVSDNSGEQITLEIDNSAVILDEIGSYPVIYSARDSAGNETFVETTISIVEPSGIDVEYVLSLADQLIAEQTTPEMSLWDKAYTLWNWCRKNIRYSYSSGNRSSVYAGAYEGLHDRQGDCYAYYATYSVLLDRLGIENICVTRMGGESNHWWNLVNLGDGWYHCDCSPRNLEHRYKCFMQTDAQLQEYEAFYVEHPGYYQFDTTLYPERETTVLFDGKPTSVRPTATPAPTTDTDLLPQP